MGLLAASLALLLAAPAADDADREMFKEREFCGQLTFLERGVKMEVTSEINAPAEKVARVLTDWEGLADIMPMTRVHEVRKKTATTARIYREIDTPFFMPDVWVLIDLERKDLKEGTQVTFTKKDGTPKRFDALWKIQPTPEGHTLLSYRATLEPPFDPPDFLLKRAQKKNIGTMLENLKKKLGTKTARAPQHCR